MNAPKIYGPRDAIHVSKERPLLITISLKSTKSISTVAPHTTQDRHFKSGNGTDNSCH